MIQEQRFLFLQGVCSPFFPRLGDALVRLGHAVHKINYCAGDSLYWRKKNATAFRGQMDRLPAFYANQFSKHAITDIVLFGDCRPVHMPAVQLAKAQNVRVHVFEEGYFRPYWITLEQTGVNGHSLFPRDPDWYITQAKNIPDYGNGTPFAAPFWKRAAHDVAHNFWAGLNPILYRGVRSHVPYSPLTEYLGYARRAIRINAQAKRVRDIESKVLREAEAHPFFLLPLQLATDAQIVHHSPFNDMAEALKYTIDSFALHANKTDRLAVKIHPLDPGLVNYRKLLKIWARHAEVADRVFYLESGHLPTLLTKTKGVVTVNSTVGGSALIHNCPTIALGKAIYDLPGLTFQNGLDEFWKNPSKPNSALYRSFRNVVIQHSQINGGFYSGEGIRMAIKNSIPRLLIAGKAINN